MSQSVSPKVDTISYEVIRHRLWQITNEMGSTMTHVSGSPVVTEVNDMMTGIFLPHGELVSFGPYIVIHMGCNPFTIRKIMEECRDEPGIYPGDMFIVNDPWYGASHQNDIVVAAPIHHNEELVCWSANMAHHLDIGAMTPGGFTTGAHEMYQEGFRFTPVKIVEKGKISKEIFNLLLNNVRVPAAVALDLKAQIAANNVAKKRLDETFKEFGAETVRATMLRMIDFTEDKFRSRLRELPDGTFRHVDRIDHDGFQLNFHEIALTMTKVEDRLKFDFSGTSPQAHGVVNCALPATYGGVLGAIGPWLCYDIPWNHGIQRVVDILAPEGSLVNATKPAAVSTASVEASWVVKNCAQACLSKLLASSSEEKYNQRAMAVWQGALPVLILAGKNQYEEFFTDIIMDIIGGGTGARASSDGLNACGDSGVATIGMPNIETHESKDPILFLHRRFVTDSGGAGKFRGGVSCEDMFVPYDTESLVVHVCAHGVHVPSNTGLFGGYPGSRNQLYVKKNTNTRELVEGGTIPQSLEEIVGEEVALEAKPPVFTIDGRDLILYRWEGGGGYGDPLDRDPGSVALDVKGRLVSKWAAERVYGVVVREDYSVDFKATAEHRDAIREIRERVSTTSSDHVQKKSGAN